MMTELKYARICTEGVSDPSATGIPSLSAVRATQDQATRRRADMLSTRPTWHLVVKRAMDMILSVLALTLSLPVVLVAAVLIRLDSAGPVIFRQQRVGKHGARFTMLKLRTMIDSAEQHLDAVSHLNEADGPLFKVTHDPRVTRVGRVLRRLSIDELPQLWNVIRGDMSLVGPRPALPRETADWPAELHRRLEVRPGITGAWQVSGRADLGFDAYTAYDLRYVEGWTPGGDVRILARTLPAVIHGRGAA